ncbi:MAG TPA: hypothetical protein DCR13_05825 [Gammaproteobacteria bacterium]|nr:hypothetical protein [Gammaproteobacteria bacterium]
MDTYAWALAKTEQYEEAKRLLQQVVINAPEVAIFNYHLAYVYQKLGQDKQAKTLLIKAKSLAKEIESNTLVAQIDALL